MHPEINPIDPVAQSGVDKFSEAFGAVKPGALLEEQRKVYEFIQENGKATPLEMMQEFSMREGDLRQILIVLRRFKMVKGARIEGETYSVPWDYGN